MYGNGQLLINVIPEPLFKAFTATGDTESETRTPPPKRTKKER